MDRPEQQLLQWALDVVGSEFEALKGVALGLLCCVFLLTDGQVRKWFILALSGHGDRPILGICDRRRQNCLDKLRQDAQNDLCKLQQQFPGLIRLDVAQLDTDRDAAFLPKDWTPYDGTAEQLEKLAPCILQRMRAQANDALIVMQVLMHMPTFDMVTTSCPVLAAASAKINLSRDLEPNCLYSSNAPCGTCTSFAAVPLRPHRDVCDIPARSVEQARPAREESERPATVPALFQGAFSGRRAAN